MEAQLCFQARPPHGPVTRCLLGTTGMTLSMMNDNSCQMHAVSVYKTFA